MNILHLSTAQSWRGGEQQLAYLIEELELQGIHQTVFCPRMSVLESHCRKNGVDVISFGKTFNLDPLISKKIASIVKSKGITHLHAHDSPSHTFSVMAAALFGNNAPIIVHRRVDFPIGKNLLSKWKYNHPSIVKIICVSDFIRKMVLSEIHQTRRLAVVHSGIDLPRFKNPSNTLKTNRLRSEFKIPNNHFLVANIAAIAPHKDYETFLGTAEKLLKSGLPAHFLAIGGDGGEEEKIRYLIQKKSLQDRVLLTGFRNDIPEILPEIDLLLFTSKTEGLGTTLLDAFACKVPVVASRTGGITELVEHGKTGLLCKVGDVDGFAQTVNSILADNPLRQRLAENSFQKVQNFGKQQMASAILKIYQETLA
ncbi:MAG: glycosyltransferase family 4 protein [Saprospiraceae bacterium]|nr:glycosyltransferase family 4 protein [Saprospiraceae bacterium]